MREILFRGKRIKTGKWGYGDLIRAKGKTFVGGEEENIFWMEAEVYPATVGQFTGLYDDKGRKVFEGDIIDVRGRFKSEVRYISLNAGYLIKDNYGWKWLYDVLASMPCEVIGNIHDNPELVKEEAE